MRASALLSISIAAFIVLSGAISSTAQGAKGDERNRPSNVHITDKAANVNIEVADSDTFHKVVALAELKGVKLKFSSEETGIMTLESKRLDSKTIDKIASIPGVVSISSEFKARALFTPNDPSTNLQWGLSTVNAYQAWDITRGNHSVVVAVLDTGIDWNHPDLAGNIWSDTNGFHGYNFISGNRLPMDDNVNSYDDNGVWIPNTYTYHGTHVAGIVGAVTDNNAGIAGMAQALLMAVKVMNDSGEGTDSTVASGMRWAVDNGADILTMSLGVDGQSTTLGNAINYASSHGVVMIAASGNSGSSVVSYPAAYPRVIAVGAVDNTDRRASFSNFGDGLDVMAPGVQIYSTEANGGYQYLSGTSTAAPFVAGVVAMMLSVNPALTPLDVGAVVNSTARDISRVGYDTSTGWGVIDAFNAVNQISGPTVTITGHPDYAAINSTFSITWMVTGGSPGVIQSTYISWGSSPTSLSQSSATFNGNTWATFTVDNIPSLPQNGTLYVQAFASVDGGSYQSGLLELPVHSAPPGSFFAQFLEDVQNFIFKDLGVVNFLIVLTLMIAIPVIVIAARPKRRRVVHYAFPQPQLHQYQAIPTSQYLPPPPPPPPRFEAYVDLVGQELMPPTLKIYEGTKVVWVNRNWAPPPGIAIKSGKIDEFGEHHDGLFESGLLIAPGDYWSATFHRPGEYDYYITGIWKSGKVVVESIKPIGAS